MYPYSWFTSLYSTNYHNIVKQLSVQFSCSAMSDSLWPHGLQHSRLPCPSPTPRVCWNSCPLSQWCHPTISSSVIPFSSCPQSFAASGSFPMSQFITSGGQSIGVSASASVLPMNIYDWFPLGLIGLITLQSKGLSGVFSNNTVQKHQFFGAQLSLQSNYTLNYTPTKKILGEEQDIRETIHFEEPNSQSLFSFLVELHMLWELASASYFRNHQRQVKLTMKK